MTLRGASSSSFFFLIFAAGLQLQPGIRAWSPARRAAGGERGEPLYTPYDPRTPLSAWWRASLSHDVYPVRRSPQGASRRASSRVAGDMRACCGAPAARGSPPRPGSLGWWVFSGFRVARRGASPSAWRFPSDRRKAISSVSMAYKRFFLPLAGGFSPAPGCGSLRLPYSPLSVWRRASLSHVVYLVRRSPHGASRRASSRFAGDMRACCGAPALRGSPPRPGSLGWWDFFRLSRWAAGSISSGMKIPF